MKNKKRIICIGAAIFAVGLSAVLIIGKATITKNRKERIELLPAGFTVTAHSGAMGTVPNSVDSLETSAENADIIEFDMNFQKDGTPVLSHDEPIGGEVTLERAFEVLSKHKNTKANVDLKSTANLPEVQRLAKKYDVTSQIFFTGVRQEDVETVKRDCPEISYYLNFDVNKRKNRNDEYIASIVSAVKESGAIGLNIHFGGVSNELTYALHESGLLVSLWTVEKERDILKVLSYLPDNITTLTPDRVYAVVNE